MSSQEKSAGSKLGKHCRRGHRYTKANTIVKADVADSAGPVGMHGRRDGGQLGRELSGR
jgi:hypothetical protein